MQRYLILLALIITNLLISTKSFSQSVVLGNNVSTQLSVYEYYNHVANSEWVKVFRVKNSNWHFGGVAGSVYFVDYGGEGASRIDFVFPQYIHSSQKPLLTLIGNSSRDILWYTLPSPNNDYYDVYIKTPPYHVGLTFMFRSYEADVFITAEEPVNQDWNWSSVSNQESVQSIIGNGNVGIGTTNPTSKLTVAGNISSREVKVSVDAGADFVFEKGYDLPSLASLDTYIKENKHLPKIASAKEMKTNGINLSEMNIKLLQKVEEMTLYMIEMKKENEKQNEKIKILENKLKKKQDE